MNSEELKTKLKTCDDKDFFVTLEQCVEFRVPSQLKNILTLNLCNNAVSLSRDIKQSIDEIEDFMRNDFDKSMLKGTETIEDYLGVFVKRQKGFHLLSGQKRMLIAIHEFCYSLYQVDALNLSANVPAIQNTATDEPPTRPLPVFPSNDVPSTSTSSDVPSTSQSSDTTSISQSNDIQSISQSKQDRSNFIKKMFDDLYTWMTKQNSLQEALKERVAFTLLPNSYVERADGSISYTVKCPFKACKRDYLLTYKSYSSYYIHKKGKRQNLNSSNIRTPRWNYVHIKKHLLLEHSNSRQTKENVNANNHSLDHDNVDHSSDDDSNDVSFTQLEQVDLTSSSVDSDEEEIANHDKNRATQKRYPLRNLQVNET